MALTTFSIYSLCTDIFFSFFFLKEKKPKHKPNAEKLYKPIIA